MITLVTLASGGIADKTWWNPYVKGGLIAVLAIGLFTGSVYLLLYTDVGTRLGFLLTAAAFSGFFAVLAVFWITGQFPNGPLGAEPGWPVQEVVSDPSQAKTEAVRDMVSNAYTADPAEAGQIRAALDEELTAKEHAVEGPFYRFGKTEDFVTPQTYTKGGGRKWPFWWSEKPTYGVVKVCHAFAEDVLPLEPPATATCDTSQPIEYAVVVKDLGARRLPAFFFFAGSSLLFLISLLALNRYERDLAGTAGGEAGPSDNGDTADESAAGAEGDSVSEPASTE
ncbi:MAG: hypothetical protein HYU28_00935 [Actinobacteria bacterium]|nr:hypothetical protein [Actinomycetota bacterium]